MIWTKATNYKKEKKTHTNVHQSNFSKVATILLYFSLWKGRYLGHFLNINQTNARFWETLSRFKSLFKKSFNIKICENYRIQTFYVTSWWRHISTSSIAVNFWHTVWYAIYGLSWLVLKSVQPYEYLRWFETSTLRSNTLNGEQYTYTWVLYLNSAKFRP